MNGDIHQRFPPTLNTLFKTHCQLGTQSLPLWHTITGSQVDKKCVASNPRFSSGCLPTRPCRFVAKNILSFVNLQIPYVFPSPFLGCNFQSPCFLPYPFLVSSRLISITRFRLGFYDQGFGFCVIPSQSG